MQSLVSLPKKFPVAALVVLLSMAFILPTSLPVEAVYAKDTSVIFAQASFLGDGANAVSGRSAAIVGDVNGDGYDDIVIGEPISVGALPPISKTILVFGKATGWSKSKPLSTIAAASFLSRTGGDGAGKLVAPAGDVNGDGFNDFLIAAPLDDTGGQDGGQVYLILGKSSGWALNTNLAQADASFIATAGNENVGSSMAGGDVNGDGYSDIVFGASDNSDIQSLAGKVYVLFGKASGWAMDTPLTNADAAFLGEGLEDKAGFSVAAGGDLNKDGFGDIIVGTQQLVGSLGKAYIIFGKASGWAKSSSLKTSGASFVGVNPNDCTGCSVAIAGDVNGDGFDDALIGAPYAPNSTQSYVGKSYLIFGKASGWALGVVISNANVIFTGEGQSDYSGERLAGGGDLNGDGYDDIVISAFQRIQPLGSIKGEVYVILGKASGWAHRSLTAPDSSFWGETQVDSLGEAVSLGGDVDGDGHDDLLMGSPVNAECAASCGKTYLLFYDKATPPMTVQSVTAYSNKDYTNETGFALPGDTVFVELRGSDQNASRADLAVLNASSDSSGIPIRMELRETGLSTGIYRGPLLLGNMTMDTRGGLHSLKAQNGDQVVLSFIKDATKNATLTIGRVMLLPITDVTSVQEDQPYDVHYTAENTTLASWTFATSASWLKFNATTKNITGTPDNSNVGSYWVRLNITDLKGRSDEHNFTLSVTNVPPAITTVPATKAVEDVPYLLDFNSTDDGQGAITWSIVTNASWLHLNATTGVINGTPRETNVGSQYVNISVNDGNGGRADRNFTISVSEVNDPPRILTTDVVTATEDQLYNVTYNAFDPDAGELFTWTLVTNASWLKMNSTTGVLSGTPTNDEVGTFYVNITVRDKALSPSSHEFNITVMNVEDPPVWTSVPVNITIDRASTYSFDVNATDVDKNDHVAYQLSVSPATATASINTTTGLLRWTPDGSGNYSFDILATDGNISIHHIFRITVRPPVIPNRPPIIVPIGSQKVTATKIFKLSVVASDPDTGDHLNFSLLGAPAGMTVSANGTIEWTPTKDQVGPYNITIRVSDGKATANATFLLTVGKVPATSNQIDKVILPGLGVTALVAGVGAGAYFAKTHAPKQSQNTQQQQQDQDNELEDMNITEALLIYKDGRIIGHKAAKNKQPDQEIEAKVKAVVRKHFEEKKELKSTVVSHDNCYVMIQKGKEAYLVAVAPGAQSLSMGAMRTPLKLAMAMNAFDRENNEPLTDWNGSTGSLKKVDETLNGLL